MNTEKTKETDANALQKEISGLSAKMDEVIRMLRKMGAGNSRKKHFADIINDNKKRR